MKSTLRTVTINELAFKAQKDELAFNELFTLLQPSFKKVIDSYFAQNNLTGFTFDRADYESITGQALWEAVKSYDITRGDIFSRFVIFAKRRMKEVTDYNLAGKRFDKSKQSLSFDELFESEEFDLEAPEDEHDSTYSLIEKFIGSDKDGKVIEILVSTEDNKLRNTLFTKLFGQYGATERKKVQRVRERLAEYLSSNGVSL